MANYAELLEEAGAKIAALEAEVKRLTECLKRANAQFEHFEREWYLRGDEIERLKAGGCRFNCRNQKEAFMAGHAAGENHVKHMYTGWSASPDEAYEQWRAKQ